MPVLRVIKISTRPLLVAFHFPDIKHLLSTRMPASDADRKTELRLLWLFGVSFIVHFAGYKFVTPLGLNLSIVFSFLLRLSVPIWSLDL